MLDGFGAEEVLVTEVLAGFGFLFLEPGFVTGEVKFFPWVALGLMVGFWDVVLGFEEGGTTGGSVVAAKANAVAAIHEITEKLIRLFFKSVLLVLKTRNYIGWDGVCKSIVEKHNG